jgi:intracellular sulfur oxidation DsrE/DsrF family protein
MSFNKILLKIFLGLLITTSMYAQNIHKVVIQVSSNDPKTQKLALNNAVNLQKFYGQDNVVIEIVAYGPGLSILTTKYKDSSRVKSLALQDIKFSACSNTINGIIRKTGKAPILTEGVEKVPAGVERIVQLEEEGYSYIRP